MGCVDFVNFASSLGGVIGGWLISYCFYRRSKKDNHKAMLINKRESLSRDIVFAYKSKKERKEKLRTISYISIQSSRDLLGTELVQDLQDILFRELENKNDVLVEIRKVFDKHIKKM